MLDYPSDFCNFLSTSQSVTNHHHPRRVPKYLMFLPIGEAHPIVFFVIAFAVATLATISQGAASTFP
jgi:hypothetical protein